MPAFKIPESVLVVVYTQQLQVLLIRRTGVRDLTVGVDNFCPASHGAGNSAGYWQSVTGSKDFDDEPLHTAAAREVFEETGIDVGSTGCVLHDWALNNHYEIWPQWSHRYAPGVTRNSEHVFGLCVPEATRVVLSPTEHDRSQWLPWQEAAHMCFSPSNAEACRLLPGKLGKRFGNVTKPVRA